MLGFELGLGLFGDVFGLLLVAARVGGVLGALVGGVSDAEVVVEALLGNAFAPAVALHLFNVIFELLAVGEALVALNGVVVVVELLLLVLLNRLALLQPATLLQLQLLVDPAARELIQVLF